MKKNILLLLFVSSLIVRLVVAIYPSKTWDIEGVYITANLLKNGGLVYNQTSRFTNPPTWLWTIGGLSYLSQTTGIPLYFLSKIPLILADLGIGYLIFKITNKATGKKTTALFLSSLYLFNPLSILISSYQVQLDSLFLFFVLLSAYILLFGKKINFPQIFFSGLFLGFAITVKLVPLGLLPIFILYLLRRLRLSLNSLVFMTIFMATTLLPLISELIPFATVWAGFVKNVFNYKTHWGLWGISLFLRTIEQIWHNFPVWFSFLLAISRNQTLSIFLVLSISYLVVILKKFSLWSSILFVFLSEIAISSYLAPQYLLWIIPFIILTRRTDNFFLFWSYSLLSTSGIIILFLFWFNQDILIRFNTLLPFFSLPMLTGLVYCLFMVSAWSIAVYWWMQAIRE